jgi:hypothetical protein
MGEVTLSSDLIAWVCGDDTGLSSKAIFQHMTTGNCRGGYPHDPADLGRCLRLLHLAPQWEERIGEMSRYGTEWANIAKQWPLLKEMFLAECWSLTPHWSTRAPETYKAMKKCRGFHG